MTGLRVLTMNLWGVRGDWRRRRKVLVDGLRSLRPDLVAFQEVIRTDDYDQARDLLGTDYSVVQHSVREADGQGICVASRRPITQTAELDLQVTERTADFACSTLLCRIALPEPTGPLLFVNHLPSWQPRMEYERELQAVLAARAIDRWAPDPDAHVVLAGDLDADPQAASVRFWTGHQSLGATSTCFRDAWAARHPDEPGPTFTPQNPLLADPDWPFARIDHILVRCGDHGGPTLPVRACERIFTEPVHGVQASDHYGLYADLGTQ